MRKTAEVYKSFIEDLKTDHSGFKTSWSKLNTIGKKDFPTVGNLVLAGRPGAGKTTLATSIVADLYMNGLNDDNLPITIYWNFEMTAEDQLARLIASYARIDFKTIFNKEEREKNIDVIKTTANNLVDKIKAHILWEDMPQNIEDMRNIVATVRSGSNRPIINVIDHTRLTKSDQKNEEVRITELARMCTYMKKEYSTLNIIVSQMNRNIEQGEFRMPRMSDMFGADSIAQEADHILALICPYREGVTQYTYGNDTYIFQKDTVIAKLVKSRTSEPDRTFVFRFIGEQFRFEETELLKK